MLWVVLFVAFFALGLAKDEPSLTMFAAVWPLLSYAGVI